VVWTASYAKGRFTAPAAIALSSDGSRLFVTGGRLTHGVATVAYQP
jgi:hypothetical protein